MVRRSSSFAILETDLPDLRYHFKCLELNERVAEDIREHLQRYSVLISLFTHPCRGLCMPVLPHEDWPQHSQ